MTRRSSIALAGIATVLTLCPSTNAFLFGQHGAKRDDHLHRRASDIASPLTNAALSTDGAGADSTSPLLTPFGNSTSNDSVLAFPTSTIHEPIATVCPGQPGGIFAMFSMPLPNPEIVSATAILPDGSKTTFASASASATTPVQIAARQADSAAEARVGVDAAGCQTLFAPRVTAICSTVVSMVGLPEVTVSECDQWITFSSETKICPTVSMPTVVLPVSMPTVSTRNTIVEGIPAVPTLPVVAVNTAAAEEQPTVSVPVEPVLPTQEVPAVSPEAVPTAAAEPPNAQVEASPTLLPETSVPESTQPIPTDQPAATLGTVETDEPLASSIVPNPTEQSHESDAPLPTQSSIPTLTVPVIPLPASSNTDAPQAEASLPIDTPDTANDTSPLNRRQAQPAPSDTTPAIIAPASGAYTAPGTYYAAAWYDVARGGIPPRVRAVECDAPTYGSAGAGGGGCSTFEERWTGTSFLRTVTETRPVSYSGPVVVTDGANTYTTVIDIATFTTTTRVTYSPTVIKQRLLADNPTPTATATAGVFAAASGDAGSDGEEEPISTTTLTGTITVTNTVYQAVVTSVAQPEASVVGGQSGGGGGEVGPDGIRTIELNSA